MVPENEEIYLAARYFVRRFGDHAPMEAAARADELVGLGDAEGHVIWLKIRDAAVDILGVDPSSTRH